MGIKQNNKNNILKGAMMTSLYEKYRPAKWSQVVGQANAMKVIRRVKKTGFGGKAFWISGISGSGKTTIARLIAKEIADDLFISEYDSAECFTAEVYEDIEKDMQLYGGGKGGRASSRTKAVKLHSKLQAIQELNKMDGIYTEGPQVHIDNRKIEISVVSERAKELTEGIVRGDRT